MSFRHIVVTGGAGFVGSHLCMMLKEFFEESAVTAYDNLVRKGSALNVARLDNAGVRFVRGDVREVEAVTALGKFDLLIECAAEPSVHAGEGASPRYVVDTNLAGAANCFEAARLHEAAVLFLSTSRVYPIEPLRSAPMEEKETRLIWAQPYPEGVSEHGVSESFAMEGFRSLYGATKLSAEHLLEEYCAGYGLRGLTLRCGVIAGPWQMARVDQGVVGLWVARHFFGGDLKYSGFGGEGKQVRDVLHVEDLCALVRVLLGKAEGWKGQCFNAGGGAANAVSLRELTALCEAVSGKSLSFERIPETARVDVPIYISDSRRLQSNCNWRPAKTVSEVVEDTWRWYTDHAEVLRPLFT